MRYWRDPDDDHEKAERNAVAEFGLLLSLFLFVVLLVMWAALHALTR